MYKFEFHFPGTDGAHYVDQSEFPLGKATAVVSKKGDVVVFSYLLVHGSYVNVSEDRVRRMFLVQLAAADDTPKSQVHRSLCNGMVLRGENPKMNADLNRRNETVEKGQIMY